MAKKMLVKLLLLLMVFEVLLVFVAEAKPWWRRRRRRGPPPCDSSMPSGVAWANSWHHSINFKCPSSKSINIGAACTEIARKTVSTIFIVEVVPRMAMATAHGAVIT